MAAITTTLRPATESNTIWGWITTIDHKRIGVLYGMTSIFYFLVGGIEALILRMQLSGPNNTLVSADTYNQLFTMHGTTMIFLVVMSTSVAFLNLIIPLQIGARDVAFPRLNAFSYWDYLFGGIMMYSSFFVDGLPDVGWFGYSDLTAHTFSGNHRVDFWIAGLLVLGVSSVAGALNFIVTIINLRAPGMRLMRMPMFTWTTLVTSTLLVLAFPVITVALVFLMFDRQFGTNFFIPAVAGGDGGDPILWQHLFWIFGHPEVYILILPAMGIVSEVIPVFSRKPLFGYPFMVYAVISIAFLGFGVWSHHMFTVGLGPVADSFFAISTMLIAVPTGIKIFNWLGTLWGGSIRFTTPLLMSIGFIAMFIIGGLSGVLHAVVPADTQQSDTYFIVAHFHYVLFGGSIFAIFSGIYYWYPKFTNRLLGEGLGKLHFWLMIIGFNLTFFPMHFLGLQGMPRRIYTYGSNMGWDFWNMVSSIGSVVIALSILIFLINFFRSFKSGKVAGSDPWDGATLEWTISSPPPHYNFETIPTVHSRDPFWEEKEKAAAAGVPIKAPVSHGHPHMPSPSFFPLIAALGLPLAAAGIIFSHALLAFGILVVLIGVYGWSFEPATKPGAEHSGH